MRGFEAVVDGESMPMIGTADGRLFRIQEFVGGQWTHPTDGAITTEAIVAACNEFCERHA